MQTMASDLQQELSHAVPWQLQWQAVLLHMQQTPALQNCQEQRSLRHF